MAAERDLVTIGTGYQPTRVCLRRRLRVT